MGNDYDKLASKMKDQTATGKVSRVVPGRLVYVDTPFKNETIACKPSLLKFRKPDGSLNRYKGEPFSSLGLKVGSQVTFTNTGEGITMIVEPEKRHKHKFLNIKLKYF